MAEVTSLMELWISGVTGCSKRTPFAGVDVVGDVRCASSELASLQDSDRD